MDGQGGYVEGEALPCVSKCIGAVESDTPAAESVGSGPKGRAQGNKIRKSHASLELT